MDSTITSTRSLALKRARAAGFSLVEVMIGASIGSFVLLGVLSTFLFLGRAGANISNYNEMEQQARRGLEYFAQDTRQASALNWNDTNSVSIVVKGVNVTYTYNPTARTFSRTLGGTTAVLISGITDFNFSGFMITGGAVDLSDLSTAATRTSASAVTKQIQISLRASRATTTVATATNTVLSARFILRNKRVTT